MRGHGLMQAIARVNRVFGDKPGGLVVDYLGLAQELKQAVATYTESGGTGRATTGPGGGGRGDAGEARGVLRAIPRLRLDEVDVGQRAGTPRPAARRARARAGPGGRQRALPRRREGAVTGVRVGRAPSGDHAHTRRCGLLPSGAGGTFQASGHVKRARTKTSTSPCGRSSRGRWRPRA